MMKYPVFWPAFVIVFCFGIFSQPAGAQDADLQDRVRVHGAVGLTKAMSPTNFSNRYRVGLNSSAAVGYEFAKYGLEPVISGGYTRYRIDPASVGGHDTEIDGGRRSIWGVSVGTYFHMNSGSNSYNGRRHLYVMGQVGVRGLYAGSATLKTVDGESSWEARREIRPGAVVGLGMEFPLFDRLSFRLEPALDVAFTEGERTGVMFLNTGLVFNGR